MPAHHFPVTNIPQPGPYQWPGTAQDQNTSPLQRDQHAEHTDRPAAPEQRLAVQPEDINQSHPNDRPAENGNQQPEQPRPSRQVRPIELLDEVCADMDDLNLATAVQLAQDDPRLDFRAAMEQQAIIMQHIHDRPLMQPEEWRTGGGEGVLYYRYRHGSRRDGMQVERDRLVVHADGPFGLVRTRSAEGVVVTRLPLRSQHERAMRDVSGGLILDRPVRR
ncbi:uncharacterized protein A1O5_09449 [Cladophialophora psammophila CBS 110553]|uniref:Uncharacterized protein n=1 Tax=Cladophialophora psammophila CBS 110553 TaxID=1182543 RepID=W9WS18_9EURO|nr:uncharacterized protein A1O5_09449 [Cladophialophora psammophila CBS 110553]EXJ67436.1 hypothetical protein A1O5_09449 [Cladophialophora psammophila CBS 110553]